MRAKNIDIQQNTDILKGDLLRLIKILEGKLQRKYRSYPCEMIDKVIIYAEFDIEYHYEHIKFANGCYLRINPTSKKEEWLSEEEYFDYLKSLISADENKYSQNSRLKNKVDNAFSLLYHIIDGSNFDDMSYSEFEVEKGTTKKWKITPEIKAKRDSVIEKKTIGKASTRRVVYLYKKPMTFFINQHFKAKSNVVILNRFESVTKGDVDHKTEIIEALTYSRNKDNIRKIREIEKELEGINNDISFSYEEATLSKYKTAIKLALQLSDPDEIAILCVNYIDFISSQSGTSVDDMFVPEQSTSNADLLKQCLDAVIQHSSKSFEELQEASKRLGKDFGVQMKRGFESQISLLRIAKSTTLPDVLYTYAVFCISIYDFKTAEKCLIECRDIYIKSITPKSSLDLVIIYSNLCKLYCDWKRVDDAIEYGKLSVKYLKRCEVFAYNDSLNIHYANLYNLLSVTYKLRYEFDKADEYNKIATAYIHKEDDSNVKVFFLQLMIAYNSCALMMAQEDYSRAYVGMELLYWKTMLLCEMDDSLEHLDLKGSYENAMARCEIHLDNLEDAKFHIEEGIKTYNKLCCKSYSRYAMSRLYLLQTLADIYDAEDLNDKAEKQYLLAIQEAYNLIDSGVYVAKGRLQEILTNLAGLYNKTEHYELAIQRCIEVLNICDELLLLDEEYYKVEIIKGLDNIAIAYYNQGNINDAVQSCQEALVLCRELLELGYNPDTVEYWTRKVQHDIKVMIN